MNTDNGYMYQRNRDFQLQLKHIESQYRRLHNLAQETSPTGGTATEQDKDFKAFKALRILKDICESTAQWAIDHQLGLACEGLSFVPQQPNQTMSHPDYISSKNKVDSHRHEIVGAELRNVENYEERNFSGELLRNFLKNLMIPNPLFLPDSIHQTYLEAFKAAEFRSTHPFYEYSQTKHAKHHHLKLELQLKALTHIEFRKGLTEDTPLKIQEIVASAYGITSDYLRKFNAAVRAELGNIEVDRNLAFTENYVSSIIHYRQKTPDDDYLTKGMIERSIVSFGSEYNDRALERDGLQYQNLKLSGKREKKDDLA